MKLEGRPCSNGMTPVAIFLSKRTSFWELLKIRRICKNMSLTNIPKASLGSWDSRPPVSKKLNWNDEEEKPFFWKVFFSHRNLSRVWFNFNKSPFLGGFAACGTSDFFLFFFSFSSSVCSNFFFYSFFVYFRLFAAIEQKHLQDIYCLNLRVIVKLLE